MPGAGPVICRLATPADKAQVVANFPDAYSGMDYLPGYYDHFMEHTERYRCFLAVQEGEIVSFHLNTPKIRTAPLKSGQHP